MSDNIFCIAEGTINEGQLDNFNAVKNGLIESSNNEPNTLNYEWFISEDG